MILGGQLASEQEIKRFYVEAEAAANLQHPNIVAIHEVGEHEDRHYFSMDFVEGQSLSRLVQDGPLPVKEAAELTKHIAEAVHYAHEQGILHRDLKPSNVLIDSSGRPRITDFGKGEYATLGLGLTIRLNEPEYASKWLTVGPGLCPNHYHKIIKETYLIIKGEVKMVLNGDEQLMKPGDKCTFGPGTWHWFVSEKGAVIEEITTQQVATDNYFEDKSIERYVKPEKG